MNKLIEHIKRVWFECCLLILTGIGLYLTAGIDEPVFRLFMFKVLLFSASQIHAHIARQLLFPYIDFKKNADSKQKLMIIVIHAASAYLYAQGG